MNRTKAIAVLIVLAAVWAFALNANAIMLRVTPDTLVNQSSVIVRGYITEMQSLPENANGEINTRVTVTIEDRIKGDAPDELDLIIPGGLLDGRFMVVSDLPDFETGQEVVLFLDETLKRIVGRIQGKFTIKYGLVKEMMIDADAFLTSLRNLVHGQEPVVDLSGPFVPVSSEEGLLRRLGDKYDYEGLRWDANSVDVYINENSNQTTGEGAAVQRAMATWTNVHANFAFIYAGTHNRISSTQNFKNEVLWSWSGYGDAIAVTQCWGDYNYLVECDLILINSTSYDWSVVDSPSHSQMDVENIAAHELGHFLQLLDLYNDGDRDKTMYGYADTGETYKRSLTQDDKNGIIHIYGGGDDDDDNDDNDDNDSDDDDIDDDDDSQDDDSQDDDSGNDDDAGGNIDSCSELLDQIYNTCDFSIMSNGQKISGDDAYQMCVDENGPWECFFECANHEQVHSCSTFKSCLDQKCGVFLAGHSSDNSDEGSSGFCG